MKKQAGSFYLFILLSFMSGIAAAAPADTLRVVAVGDVMLGTAYPSAEYLPPNNDCSPLLSPVKPYIRAADVAFANLEGALTDSLGDVKKCRDTTICYAFAMPAAYAKCLADAGFDLLSIANNHTGDFGEKGRAQTVNALRENGIACAGLLTCPTAIIERQGLKIGFCAFSVNKGTCSVTNLTKAEKIVRGLDSLCDVVIVSFHAGAEGADMRHVARKTETFVGEDRGNVYEFARRMVDAGGDILLGHGPHVTRAVDIYKERFIAYSMGNFCTYSRINLKGVNGVAPLFRLSVDRQGKFLNGNIIPTAQAKGVPMRIDSARRVIREIQLLTKEDFPEAQIKVDDDGKISVR
jgi:poly-gamma-glutamate capsule biosynthesis protein CapA/YwtB (metallophosphatase superfamily)